MLALTARFVGLVALDRERFGGIDTGDGASAFGLAASGTSDAETALNLTHPFAGLIGAYRDVSAVSALSESAGASAFPFAAAGYSSDLQDLTGSFGGLIAVWREVSITPTTQYTFTLSAIVNGTVDPLTAATIELTMDGTVSGGVVIGNDIRAVGASSFPFAALARAGAAAVSVFPFTVFGGGTAVQNPLITAAGKGTFPFAAAAVGAPTWPMVGTSAFPFTGAAIFEGEAHGVGASAFPFVAQAVSPGYSLAVASSTFPFAAAARAIRYYGGVVIDADTITATVQGYGQLAATVQGYGQVEWEFV